MPLVAGDKLGPYEILAPIGAGSMGEVYKARDSRLDRIVAIKKLKNERSTRLEQEARAIAALNHPHVCSLYDVGPDYLVMEFVDGKPIKGPLPVEEAVRLAVQMASALEEAHSRGILHRDLKPGNILVTSRGTVKLLDFGLAKLTGEDTEATQTIEGTVLGTAAYMSPEQAQGKPLDERSDVFSFGAVLYEMLSSQRAFRGGSTLDVLNAVVTDEPRPIQAPQGLMEIVKRCLAKQTSERFQCMAEVKQALERAMLGPVSDAAVRPPSTVVETARGNDDSRQVEAYSYYERARKNFGQVGKEALEQAQQDFARALEISPGYAMAHSGLGAAYALRSLNRRLPEDFDVAQAHLEKALELDPELAEPYPWLCYVLMRKNQMERALQAGRHGVQLQPDLVQAHYFLGLGYMAASEQDAANYQNAASHLLDAARIGPQWQPTWFVLSYAALLTGQYKSAEEYASRLLEMSLAPNGLPFIGAEIVLGSVKLRQGNPGGARELLLGFLERMTGSDHMYRDAMSAAAACILGDVELRHGDSADAMAAYRRAWHTVQENPRIIAYRRTAARAQAGLASAYAAQGDRVRAVELLDRAVRAARESELPEHAAAAASLAELYWSTAAGCARLGDAPGAFELVRNAVRTGWRDAGWMERDPELEIVREEPAFRELVEEVRLAPRVRFETG
jgi:tetratricopeptide (TPR) repeat protein/tRNA A-37 threonylcarbamoyl transferase component Bud32